MSVVASAAVKPKDSLPPLPPGTRKVGRNEPCPCGRGDKYKFCHYRVA
ncbi:SEC-C metal-binding domain-containing protein [Mesorhizobium sp. LNHC232B00]|nr:SEC-C metal-binding domain-containing protein [Mesorhizobium sp. LNHC232B00]